MKKTAYTSLLLLFLTAVSSITAQQKNITLEDIWSGEFRAEYLNGLRSLDNGKEYSVLNQSRSGSTIDIYDYKTGKKVKTLVSSNTLSGIDQIISYEFSDDESKLLLATRLQQIYRRSSLGTYYVYDIDSKKVSLVSEEQIQEPTFTKDGSKIAYGKDNNLYVKNLQTGETTQITKDGEKNSIINGITDWVYEEEFAFVRAFDWNKTGNKLAYIKFDETDVPRFSMDVYGKELYPSQQVFKYPKAGEPNAKVSLHIYDLSSDKTNKIDLAGYNSYYIPRIKWTNEEDILSAQLTNRHQNTVDLVFVDAKNNSTKRILQEKDDAYVDITDNLTFLNNNNTCYIK